MKRSEVYQGIINEFLAAEDIARNPFLVLYLEELTGIFNTKDESMINLELSNFTFKTFALLPMLKPTFKNEISILSQLTDRLKLIVHDISDELNIHK